jgi:hypothetical protein
MVPMPIMMGMLQLVQHASTARARSREQQLQAQHEFRKLELRLGAENERWRQQAAFLAQMHASLLQFDEAKLKAILEIYRTCHRLLEADQRALHEEQLLYAQHVIGANADLRLRVNSRNRSTEIDERLSEIRQYSMAIATFFVNYIARLPGAVQFSSEIQQLSQEHLRYLPSSG